MAAGFGTQANALLRKNLTFQKRNVKANIRLVAFPIVLCLLILAIQILLDKVVSNNDDNKCGCICVRRNGDECEEERCGIEHSNLNQAVFCRIPNPPEWPPLLQIPAPEYRAVRNDFMTFTDLPNESCKINGSCPAIFLLTGNNRSFGEILGENMLPNTFSINPSNLIGSLASNVAGSESEPGTSQFLDSAFFFGSSNI
ncbi:ABC transporter A family member 7-like [Pistacia vera]|uniref:ABC transporter A family member 7-like n=1 Tax=Pistacia vera TaxID=55513 RepID=UPI001262F97E|nr:ABC transporter A family member 7-like [Pistacia vera]